jgi:hypothetical protein
VQWM